MKNKTKKGYYSKAKIGKYIDLLKGDLNTEELCMIVAQLTNDGYFTFDVIKKIIELQKKELI